MKLMLKKMQVKIEENIMTHEVFFYFVFVCFSGRG